VSIRLNENFFFGMVVGSWLCFKINHDVVFGVAFIATLLARAQDKLAKNQHSRSSGSDASDEGGDS
jgi:hypothetical protein